MQKALNARFKFIIDPLDSDFDSIYMAATYLTPAYRCILNTSQTKQVKDFLLDLMKEDDDQRNHSTKDHFEEEIKKSRDCDDTVEPSKNVLNI